MSSDQNRSSKQGSNRKLYYCTYKGDSKIQIRGPYESAAEAHAIRVSQGHRIGIVFDSNVPYSEDTVAHVDALTYWICQNSFRVCQHYDAWRISADWSVWSPRCTQNRPEFCFSCVLGINDCVRYESGNAKTRVVNLKHAEYDVLIDRTTIFGNPFSVKQHGREECIRKFKQLFYSRMAGDTAEDREYRNRVLMLRGKTLGCHCLPLSCHGSVYADYLNSLPLIDRARSK